MRIIFKGSGKIKTSASLFLAAKVANGSLAGLRPKGYVFIQSEVEKAGECNLSYLES